MGSLDLPEFHAVRLKKFFENNFGGNPELDLCKNDAAPHIDIFPLLEKG
jgi:hypothetical protein